MTKWFRRWLPNDLVRAAGLRLRLLVAFADNPPITVVANALRGLMLGADALAPGQAVTGQALLALGWSVAILVVFAPLAVQVYRRGGLTRLNHIGHS